MTTRWNRTTWPVVLAVSAFLCGEASAGCGVELAIDDVPDPEELNPGAYIAFNDDDDNRNSHWDYTDAEGTSGEGDLVQLKVWKSHDCTEGTIVLAIDSTKVRIWDNDQRQGTPLIDPTVSDDAETWNAADFDYDEDEPLVLWVEGIEPSDYERDTEIQARWEDDEHNPEEDSVNVTVVQVDLDMAGVDDEKEESEGGFIALNDDDDDENQQEDGGQTPGVANEDNLVQIALHKVLPTDRTGSLYLEGDDGLMVWENSDRTSPVYLPACYNTPGDLPATLYVEGIAGSSSVRDMELNLSYNVGGKTFEDTVQITVVDVQSVAVDEAADSDTHKIASVIATGKPKEHFVTVKGLAGDITLIASISPDTPETQGKIGWTDMTQDATNKLKATKVRATADKFPATVNVGGKTAHQLVNWVVWAEPGPRLTAPPMGEDVLGDSTRLVAHGYSYAFEIPPEGIIETLPTDVPNLTGASDPPGAPDVPTGDTRVYNKGVDLSKGGDHKWDGSRQLRNKVVNRNGVDLSTLGEVGTSHANWPSAIAAQEVCGNDDLGPAWDDNDPYTEPNVRFVTGFDCPELELLHSIGELGNTVEFRCHFRNFARLQLDGK